MSKYTDWLNTEGLKVVENGITAVDFVRVCAWGAKEMAYYHPEGELTPLEEIILLDQEQLNKDLIAANEAVEEIPEDVEGRENLYEATRQEKEDERKQAITDAETLIALYGTILADLCRWDPKEQSMKTLKTFAIKELTTNMPNMTKYATPVVMPDLDKFIKSEYSTRQAKVNQIITQMATEQTANATANAYIAQLNDDITSLENIVSETGTATSAIEPQIGI